MKALLLSQDFPPERGGVQVLMGGLATHLRRLEPRVVTMRVPGGADWDRRHGISVLRVARKRGGRHRAAVGVLNLAAVGEGLRRRPGVVISGHVTTAPAALTIGALGSAPVVQYVHADEFRYRRGLTRVAVRRADVVIAVSSHARTLAIDLGADPKRVHVVHPASDADTSAAPARREGSIVVTLARLVDLYKGHDVLVRALPLVRSRVADVEWVVIGEGRLHPWLEGLARAHGVADCTNFVGSVDDAERDRWLDAASVLAMPGRLPARGVGGEGFGIAYLEAAAHGVPVVAGDVAGAVDAVADGETGRLVDPTDHVAVADAIAGLLADPELAGRLGAEARARAAASSWSAHAERVEELALAARRRR